MADTGAGPRVLLDRYELREQVGRGGMGEVWLGRDRRLRRDVAIKLLLPQLSEEPAFRARFAVEARIAAALEHPNVVNVYDIDEDAGSVFIVMERLPGPSLDQRLGDGPLREDEVRRLAADLLSGLGAAHAQDLVHRDVKPGNLILSAGGRWKVGDFGVAKDLASAAQLTLAGVAVGTPAYLAPEQLQGLPATPATDLWAAAVVLREAVTGQRPFEGDDPVAVAWAVQHTPLVPLAHLRPDLDPALTAAVDRGLSADPAQRFVTAAEMLDAVEGRPTAPAPSPSPAPALVEAPVPSVPEAPAPPPARRSGLVLAAIFGGMALAAFLVLVAVVALLVLDDDGSDPPTTTVASTLLPSSAPPDLERTPATTRPTTRPTTEPPSEPPSEPSVEEPADGSSDDPLGSEAGREGSAASTTSTSPTRPRSAAGG